MVMDFQQLVDSTRTLEVAYRVTPDVYFGFQRVSLDFNPLHTDEAFAQGKGFASKVMYGNILNGFISHFVGMALPTRNVMIQTQDIQFRKPIYLDDEIILKASHEDISEAVGIINFKLKFYRPTEKKQELVATGHVQIGLLYDK